MCNWKKWIWPGILAVLLLTALATMMKSGAIEQDLQAKALNDLSSEHKWAKVQLDGRDLTLSGIAPSEDAAAEALQIAEDAYDVRVASSQVELLPISDPFNFSAEKSDNKMILSGSVPSDEQRAALTELAKSTYPGAEIVDQLRLARGSKDGFGDLAGFGISQLAGLTAGKTVISNTELSLSGSAPSVEIFDTVTANLKNNLPTGSGLGSVDISAPTASPYTFKAAKSASGIVLDGYVPSQQIRSKLVGNAKISAVGKAVTDNLKLTLGQPDGFSELANFAISQLTHLQSGDITTSDKELSIKGLAKSNQSLDAITAALETLPGGGKLALENIKAPDISPYILSATKSDTGIVINGYAPDEKSRAEIINAAKKASRGAVSDNLKIGSGAPEGYSALAAFGVMQLNGLTSGKASLDGLDLTVMGTASTPTDYDQVTSALSGSIPANGKVVSSDITRSTVSPYTFSANKDKGILILEGYVQSEKAKSEIVGFAAISNKGDRIVDRLIIANGAPKNVDWTSANKFAVEQAGMLSKGTANLTNEQYSVEGMAASGKSFAMATKSANEPLNFGLKLRSEIITQPIIKPYTWTFSHSEGAAPLLSGYVPDMKFADANIKQIESLLGTQEPVTSSLETGAGVPANFEAATSIAIQTASRLRNGKAEISGTNLLVSGEALSQNAADAIRTQIENGFPQGYHGSHAITVLEVTSLPALGIDQCQASMTKNLEHNSIQFETNKSAIKSDSFGLLDRLAFAVKRCPTVDVEISGHTDSDGSDDYNQALSEERANAVRSYLVNTGIFVGRLKAKGYGESKPIADNATDEGKAKNRRIEFNVIR